MGPFWVNYPEVLKVTAIGSALAVALCVLGTIYTNVQLGSTDPNAPSVANVSLELLLQLVWCPPDDTFDAFQTYIPDLLPVTIYCQALISASRFFAVSFNGTFFMYTTKWPFGQLIFGYVLGGIGSLCSICADHLFYEHPNLALTIRAIKTMFPMAIVCFMITLDGFTFRKVCLFQRQEGKKAARVDRRLAKQVICSSSVYFIYYLLTPLFYISFCRLFGMYLLEGLMQIVSIIQWTLLTLGLSCANVLLLRKVKVSMTQQSTVGKRLIEEAPHILQFRP
ncbi:unnamed protein product, partial [Mesorhabditis belari]|uniref:Uncharacterized protein n=1 Tax=Mesorhabditis belari TaxID=2138241 RepID=A0AAF3EKE7_9BILA